MRLDFLAAPALAERWAVIDADSGEPIDDIAWADDESGVYATIKKRPRTFNDLPGADLRIKSESGNFALQSHRGPIEFVDRTVSPFKAELMALLEDPDVVDKIAKIVEEIAARG